MIIDPYAWSSLAIISVEPVALGTVLVTVEKPAVYSYEPGQYAVVRGVSPQSGSFLRQYSLVSAPSDAVLSFLIQREPHGVASTWFCENAKPGDSIEVSRALGTFILDGDDSSRDVFIAGRVGIAPFISMLRHHGNRAPRLIYSVRDKGEMYVPELLAKHNARIVETSKENRIDATLLGSFLEPNQKVYICGSKQFVDAMAEHLLLLGVTPNRIKRELFTLQ